MLFYTADRRNTAYGRISGRLEEKQENLAVLCDYEDFIRWLEYTGVTACRLCALPKNLDFLLHEDLWNSGKPYLLTSATLSVGGDFSRYMHQTGIDLAGDILSSLVVVKLPFPVPDPVLEYEKPLHEDFHEYLAEVIAPGMLMKLRQWIGRGIRRETDTCVFSILDCRGRGRYKNDILAALPDMPVTEKIEDVGIFIRGSKPENYFGEKNELAETLSGCRPGRGNV